MHCLSTREGRNQHEFLPTKLARCVTALAFVPTARANQEALPANIGTRLAVLAPPKAFQRGGRVGPISWTVTLPAS